jgi:hypothetical protein
VRANAALSVCRCCVFVLALILTVTAGAQAQFVASKNSNKYHTTDCEWALKIAPRNQVEFRTVAEAEKKGYSPCKVCAPGSRDLKLAPGEQSVPQERAVPKTDGRCQATTKKGNQCSRKAVAGSGYCWQHNK